MEPPNSQIMKRYITEVKHFIVIMTLLRVLLSYVFLCFVALPLSCHSGELNELALVQDSSKNIQISAFHIFKVLIIAQIVRHRIFLRVFFLAQMILLTEVISAGFRRQSQ